MAIQTAEQVRKEMGLLIARSRIAEEWSTQELADHLAVHLNTVRRLEAGLVTSLDTYVAALATFGYGIVVTK